jgi:prlF antitoxin for toxin YhaV_toxin
MAVTKKGKLAYAASASIGGAVYSGKQAKTGNSKGFRFDKALFQSHPEFNGTVEARVIGPGHMLVIAEPTRRDRRTEDDPMLSTFLSFLASNIKSSPENIRPIEQGRLDRIGELTSGVNVDADEDLGDEGLI